MEASKTIEFEFDFKKSSKYTNSSKFNELFVRAARNYYSDVIKCVGYCTVSDIVTALGLEPSINHHFYGWIYSEDSYKNYDIFYNPESKVVVIAGANRLPEN